MAPKKAAPAAKKSYVDEGKSKPAGKSYRDKGPGFLGGLLVGGVAGGLVGSAAAQSNYDNSGWAAQRNYDNGLAAQRNYDNGWTDYGKSGKKEAKGYADGARRSASFSEARSIAAKNRPRGPDGRFLPGKSTSRSVSLARSLAAERRPRDAQGRFLPSGSRSRSRSRTPPPPVRRYADYGKDWSGNDDGKDWTMTADAMSGADDDDYVDGAGGRGGGRGGSGGYRGGGYRGGGYRGGYGRGYWHGNRWIPWVAPFGYGGVGNVWGYYNGAWGYYPPTLAGLLLGSAFGAAF